MLIEQSISIKIQFKGERVYLQNASLFLLLGNTKQLAFYKPTSPAILVFVYCYCPLSTTQLRTEV